jgi:hypothetical protein
LLDRARNILEDTREYVDSAALLMRRSITADGSGGRSEGMPMTWRRLRRMSAAGLGLFALLLQLAVSFGHVHTEGLQAAIAAAGSHGSNISSRNAATAPSDQQQAPGHRDSEDDCPICMVLHMAATGLQPIPPAVFAPVEFSEIIPRIFIQQFELRAPRGLLFQTRAPPVV